MDERLRGHLDGAPAGRRFARARAVLFWCHLAVGVAVALVVVVMGSTGAMMSFEHSIVDRFESRWRVDPPDDATAALPPSRLRAAVETERATPVAALTTYADRRAPALVVTKDKRAWLVDPYRGELLAESRVRGVFSTIEDVHRNIALARVGKVAVGKTVTGYTAVGVALAALTGPLLWWPRKRGAGRFRAIVFFTRTSSPAARDFNWHNVLGIWAAPLLLLIALTGTSISFDGVKGFVTSTFGAAKAIPEPPPEPAAFDLDRAWAEAGRRVPEHSAINGRWPARDGKFTLRIRTRDGTRPDQWSQLVHDERTGAVTAFTRYETSAAGTKILGWARWTHTGQAFGVLGQGLAAFAALSAVALACTGLALSWRRARRAWRKRARPQAPPRA